MEEQREEAEAEGVACFVQSVALEHQLVVNVYDSPMVYVYWYVQFDCEAA